MRWWFATLWGLAACTEGPPIPDDLASFDPGHYSGTLHFEAKAKVGPVRVGKDGCDAPMNVWVNVDGDPVIVGTATCTLEQFGDVTVQIGGDVTTLPFVAGDVVAADTDGAWSGWFVDEATLHAEANGKIPEGPAYVVYAATMDVALDPMSGPGL